MAGRQLTSRELTTAYLNRIVDLNPSMRAIIETNPQEICMDAQHEAERPRCRVRGPVHGNPIVLKGHIHTADRMETTGGSYAHEGSKVPADAPLVAGLRRAGAVILGKANLSEWANF